MALTKVHYTDNETVIGAKNLNDIQDEIIANGNNINFLNTGKVDKVAGKGLSTLDFTVADRQAISNAYVKPTAGVPKTDLSQDVQTSLDKADNSLQAALDETLTVQGAAADAKATGDAVGELKSALYDNNIPTDVGFIRLSASQISDASSKGVTVTVTGGNKFKLNGTATADFWLGLDFAADTNSPLAVIEHKPVYFIMKRSDDVVNDLHCSFHIFYFNAYDEAVYTPVTESHLFNVVTKADYNSDAKSFRSTLGIWTGASFNNVEFEFIVLYAEPQSAYISPDITTKKYDDVPLTFEAKTGYYTDTGAFATYSDIWGATVNIDPSKKYHLAYRSFYAVSETVFFDSNNVFVSAVTSHNDFAPYEKDFYPPANAATMLIQAYGASTDVVEGRTHLSYENGLLLNGDIINVYDIPYNNSNVGDTLDSIASQSPLFGKKIAYNGDSIVESRLTGTAANGGGFAKIIADITGGTYDNQAVSGGILGTAVPSGEMPHSVVNTLGQMPNDADLYCFDGGLNDFWRNVPLGTYSETDYRSAVDASTVCGALEYILRAFTHYHVGKPCVFVFIHKAVGTMGANSAGYTYDEMREKMIGICRKYAIPFYDAYVDSGLNGYNDIQNTTFLTANASGAGDGIHPNESAYKKYYVPQLISLFESLMPVN